MTNKLKSIVLALSIAATGLTAIAVPMSSAHAIIVFDPSNYAQNILTAARALNQINNQIKSLANEAMMLKNMARNLSTIDFPELSALKHTLGEIDMLIDEAKGIDFKIENLDRQFSTLFPNKFDLALRNDAHVIDAKARLDAAMSSFRETMAVQSRIADAVRSDAETLSSIAAKSQGAEGSLQAQQATNQLLALAAKQQFQMQELMAAQYRAQATEAAMRVQGEADARATTTKFLGSGVAYTPH
jgi:P-type conjugative transfer protein TrbJ